MRINDKKLRHVMIDRDIGQTQLAERAGLSRTTINGVCCGRSCTSTTAFKIADTLQVPLEELVENGGT